MPIYEFICTRCQAMDEKILPVESFKDYNPICCGIPMQRLVGSMAYWQWKNDRNGTTPGIRKYAAEITRKSLDAQQIHR